MAFFLIIIILMPSVVFSEPFPVVNPEHLTRVGVSNREVNRIVCSGGEISDWEYSQERKLRIKHYGDTLFVKFPIFQKITGQQVQPKAGDEAQVLTPEVEFLYDKNPAELYVVCNEQTYILYLVPQDRQATTIILDSPEGNMTANVNMFRGLPWERKLGKIVRMAFRGEMPSSFQRLPVKGRILDTGDSKLDARIAEGRQINGLGLRVYVVRVVNKSERPVFLNEKSFLTTVQWPAAVSIEDPRLVPGQATRVVVVERYRPGHRWRR